MFKFNVMVLVLCTFVSGVLVSRAYACSVGAICCGSKTKCGVTVCGAIGDPSCQCCYRSGGSYECKSGSCLTSNPGGPGGN